MHEIVPTDVAPEEISVQGEGVVAEPITEGDIRLIERELALVTRAVTQYPARIPDEILENMAAKGWELVNNPQADSRAKAAGLRFLQSLLACNVKLVTSVFDRQKKKADETTNPGGTCIKIYNNININNV